VGSKAQPVYFTELYCHVNGNTQAFPRAGPLVTTQGPSVVVVVVGVVLVFGIVTVVVVVVVVVVVAVADLLHSARQSNPLLTVFEFVVNWKVTVSVKRRGLEDLGFFDLQYLFDFPFPLILRISPFRHFLLADSIM